MSWNWILSSVVYAIHDRQLQVHGGLPGLRDKNAVESALQRAPSLDAYGNPPPTAAELAAAYIYGLATNHGFSDGNKRIAWVVGRLFLKLNGIKISYTEAEAISLMMNVAAGTRTEGQIATWIDEHIVP